MGVGKGGFVEAGAGRDPIRGGGGAVWIVLCDSPLPGCFYVFSAFCEDNKRIVLE